MKIEIDYDQTIGNIKDSFEKKFPNLKLEFFSGAHGSEEASPKEDILNDDTTLKELNLKGKGNLVIENSNTVAEVEKKFGDDYGLNVQVFRKSGNLWLETTTTDGWSLEKHQEVAIERAQSL